MVLPIGLVFAIILCKDWGNFSEELARAIDIFCNVAFQYALTPCLLKKSSVFKFGHEGVYVSDVLKFNYSNETCTKFGKFWCRILIDLNDPSFKK